MPTGERLSGPIDFPNPCCFRSGFSNVFCSCVNYFRSLSFCDPLGPFHGNRLQTHCATPRHTQFLNRRNADRNRYYGMNSLNNRTVKHISTNRSAYAFRIIYDAPELLNHVLALPYTAKSNMLNSYSQHFKLILSTY